MPILHDDQNCPSFIFFTPGDSKRRQGMKISTELAEFWIVIFWCLVLLVVSL